MLLDSQSTIDLFSNSKLLTKIQRVNTTLRIRCNAGTATTDWQGYLPGYGWVWFYPKGIANILSLSRVKEKFRVTFDCALDNCFHVHKGDRNEVETMFITTVADNKSKLSAQDVLQATRARALQRIIGRPSTSDLIRYITSNEIKDCPITVQDVKNAEFIWGPELGSLKGKTVRDGSPQVRMENAAPIPVSIMQ